ncbi:hypothetical protein PV433_24000 [Paenibacillus sp. GYB004]|uniref:putative ABC transporter permease subunit n=1 Tax=Paenibacillus sp. GYB004 TaxID=2994393 RepID=UPI002F9648E4
MNKTLALTRILIKNGSGQFSKSGKRGKLPTHILLPILLAVALLPFASILGGFVAFLYDGLKPIGQEGAVLGLGLSITSLVVFMFGIFYIITVFYFAQDVEYLLPLPLKPSQIVSAKFLTVLLYEYLTQLVLLAPLLIVFGVKDGAGVMYYVYAVITFLALPILPLVVASVVAMAIMSFSGVARNKDRFRLIGGTVAVLFSLGLNLFIQRSVRSTMTPEEVQNMLLGGGNTFLDLATRSVPSVKLAANAMLKEAELAGLAFIVLFAGFSVLLYVAFALLAQTFYFKGVMGMSESSARRIQLSGQQLDKMTVQQSAVRSMLMKELRILLRTPPYFLNCVFMTLMWPIIMLIPLLSQPDLAEMLGQASQYLDQGGIGSMVLAGGVGVFLFISGANATASTSISREGAGFFVLKYIPVPVPHILTAKVMSGWLVTMIGTILILGAAYFLIHLPIALILLLLMLAVPATLFTCLTGVWVDLFRPVLNWDNEQKAVKQNMNSVFNLLICVAFAGLLFFLVSRLGLSLTMTAIVLMLILVAADLLLYRLLQTKGQIWFTKIEN